MVKTALIIVLDVGSSMATTDGGVSRLESAKAVVDLRDAAPGPGVGVRRGLRVRARARALGWAVARGGGADYADSPLV